MEWRIKGSKNQVIVTNYLQAHDNCILKGDKYSVCCANECESLLTSLESQFGAVSASPEAIWKVLGILSKGTATGGSWASNTLGGLAKLKQIANVNDGMVPLHSVDFAYFLHFAFPRDCPIPRQDARGVASTAVPLTPAETANWGITVRQVQEPQNAKKDIKSVENASVPKSTSTWDRVMRDQGMRYGWNMGGI